MLEITGRGVGNNREGRAVTGKEQGQAEHRGFDRHVKEPAGAFYAPSGLHIATLRIAVESISDQAIAGNLERA